MKVLQLTIKPPIPAVDGGCIAIKNFSDMILDGGNQLKILSLATHKHPFEEELIPQDFKEKTEIEAVFIKTELNVRDAFASMVTMDSYNISRFFSVDFDARLEEILLSQEFDFIQLESLFMTPYISTIRRNTAAPIVLRSHNFEHSIWEQIASREDSRFKRWYLKFLASRLKKYELEIMDAVDGVIAISSTDESRYKRLDYKIPVTCIPFGINLDDYPASRPVKNPPRIFHLGAMDWQPNIEGIQWFLNNVWPEFMVQQPNAELYLAGRSMDIESFKGFGNRVHLVGEVDDAQEFMLSNDIMVVPLNTGSGIRIKILEGMAMGKTVISTKIGAEGIEAKDGVEIFIAESARDFQEILNKLYNEPELIAKVGAAAREFAHSNFNQRILRGRFEDFSKKLMKESPLA